MFRTTTILLASTLLLVGPAGAQQRLPDVPPAQYDAPPPLTSGTPTPSVWPAAPLTATPVTPPLGVPVPPGPTVPPAAASLTVANVHKESVSIFRVRDGRLEFVAQVPPGEAVPMRS